MREIYFYIVILMFLMQACESVYVPELENVENVLVVDARLEATNHVHRITLKKSKGFTEAGTYEPVVSADIILMDEEGYQYQARHDQAGVYYLDLMLDSTQLYKLHIYSEGERYASEFEQVPPSPVLDTVYLREYEQWIQPGGADNVGSFEKMTGQQILVDVTDGSQPGYYQFTGRKILQFMVELRSEPIGETTPNYHYGWRSLYPLGSFNIAGPALYSQSKDITRHPLDFLPYRSSAMLDSNQVGMGWIYIVHQYSINESTYRFYRDLKSQLDAGGKIFDPLYTQAKSNMKCITSKQKVILGYFGISNRRERRYFIRLNQGSGLHTIRKIDAFHEIPEQGVVLGWPPSFWER
jgi:hypothetical protein